MIKKVILSLILAVIVVAVGFLWSNWEEVMIIVNRPVTVTTDSSYVAFSVKISFTADIVDRPEESTEEKTE